VKAEKESTAAEERIESIQAICLKEQSTKCICPKCGTHHRVKLLWTGRGMPRKFCPVCKHYSSSINDSGPFSVSRSAGALSQSAL
jgi:hypothetical protein